MCGGGDDSGGDSNDNNQSSSSSSSSGGSYSDLGMSPGRAQAEYGNTANAGKTAGEIAAEEAAARVTNIDSYTSKEDYVRDTLTSKGYSDDYKGVKSGTTGKSVTDSKGNPVRSGSYVEAENRADATFDAYQDYKVAREEAEKNFYADMSTRPKVDQDIIDAAMNKGGFVRGDVTSDAFDPTNVEIGIGPPSLENLTNYGTAVGGYADEFSFPGYSFSDPYGTAMAPTVSRIDGSSLGSNITTKDESRYSENFNKGFNEDTGLFGSKMETDAAGNVGYSTFSQRAGDLIGTLVKGYIGSQFGPLGTLIAAGTDFNTMNQYGPNVEGFNPVISTTSFGPANAVGGYLGSKVGSNLVNPVAQTLYNSTGNVNAAIAGAVAAPIAVQKGGEALGSMIDDRYGLNMVSTNISSPYDQAVDDEMEERGFGARLNASDTGSPTGDSSMNISQLDTTPVDTQETGDKISEQTVQEIVGSDVGEGEVVGQDTDKEFVSNQFILDQVEDANPNTTQIVDFFGNQPVNLEANPLFLLSPPGVQYLTKGRQRGFGNAIFNVQNRAENQMRSRRAGLNDSLIGTVIG